MATILSYHVRRPSKGAAGSHITPSAVHVNENDAQEKKSEAKFRTEGYL